MANTSMSDQTLREALRAVEEHGTTTAAAKAMGIPRSTLQSRLTAAQSRFKDGHSDKATLTEPPIGVKGSIDRKKGEGWLELTDYEMPSPEEVLEKYKLDPACWRITRVSPNQWQGFYKTGKNESAKAEKVTLCQLKIWIERIVPDTVEEAAKILAERVKALPAPRKLVRSQLKPEGQLAVAGIYDAHVGSLCWGEEVGGDYDIQIAGNRVKNSIDDLTEEISHHNIAKMIVPIGNDFMHFDNFRGETSSGRVIVDQDTRYPRVLVACHDLLAYQIERSLEICDEVDILWIPGNHDLVASLHLCHWLAQRYRNDPRVTVDTSPRRRKYRSWGGTLLGFTHGDRINPKETYRLMAEEAKDLWASATCREWHTGDKHHRKQIDQTVVDSIGTVTFRINPSLAQADFWHYDQGYTSVRCADVWRYTRTGFVGMATAYARDTER